jgi:hypothetical protein
MSKWERFDDMMGRLIAIALVSAFVSIAVALVIAVWRAVLS